jgi:uncharacterized membrane protein YcaP (DUF421 family)
VSEVAHDLQSAVVEVLTAKGSDLDPLLVIPRTVIVVLVAIIYVRVAKKRFLAQASAMDLVTAVILGSVLSRAINGGATLANSLAAGLVVIVMQRLLIHFSSESHAFGRLVKGSSQVLVRNGVVDDALMSQHNISTHDLYSEMRLNGQISELAQVGLATLERNGRISIVPRDNEDQPGT